ncbi:hypothetical protein GHK46_20175 [Sinorhizobium medicae]|uniref:hypothetical protein n=1 Tax=Sinorhizobium medicae TaxID=110321 RepID=UPI001294C19F|nr:hypothetical protein [Sinorhizobium medicae]MQV99550.1 hypothetical protein [Sinorhizobium medicae]
MKKLSKSIIISSALPPFFLQSDQGSTPDKLRRVGCGKRPLSLQALGILRGTPRAWQAGKMLENADTFSNLSTVIRPDIYAEPMKLSFELFQNGYKLILSNF